MCAHSSSMCRIAAIMKPSPSSAKVLSLMASNIRESMWSLTYAASSGAIRYIASGSPDVARRRVASRSTTSFIGAIGEGIVSS